MYMENVKITLFCKDTRMPCWKSLGISMEPNCILLAQIRWYVSGMLL